MAANYETAYDQLIRAYDHIKHAQRLIGEPERGSLDDEELRGKLAVSLMVIGDVSTETKLLANKQVDVVARKLINS